VRSIETDHIEMRLNALLHRKKINDESTLVYLLFLSRNLLERGNFPTLPTLKFYCTFGLNAPLCRADARSFLEMVSPILTGADGLDKQDALKTFLTLKQFQKELRTLLQSFSPDLSVCEDSQWVEYLKLYSKAVQDSKLILEEAIQASSPERLAVKKLTIRPAAQIPFDDLAATIYPMLWEIEYEDGRVGRVYLENTVLARSHVQLMANQQSGMVE